MATTTAPPYADLWQRLLESKLGVALVGDRTLTIDWWSCGCCGDVYAYRGHPYDGPLDDAHGVYGESLGGFVFNWDWNRPTVFDEIAILFDGRVGDG